MSKTMCKDWSDLSLRIEENKPKYYCKKCKRESPKEKWCCKPKKL